MHALRSTFSTVSLALALCSALVACERGGAGPATSAPPAGARPPGVTDAARPDAGPVAPRYLWPPPADVSLPPVDAEREPSGVVRKIVAAGTAKTHPTLDAFVDLRYAGWERNGRQFEGTAATGDARRYDMKDLTPGLAQELQQMVEGDRRRIWVPAALAYAKREDFANAPKGDMTFEVELERVVPKPAAPPDLKEPPKEAKTTKSGLRYLVLAKGKGKRHPQDETRAEVIYTGWTPDGRMFQTSVAAGDKGTVRVRLLPPGWREAMKMMVEGDRWRLWLTGKLGFGELAPGAESLPFGPPAGPVVYDVELLRIAE